MCCCMKYVLVLNIQKTQEVADCDCDVSAYHRLHNKPWYRENKYDAIFWSFSVCNKNSVAYCIYS